VQLAGTSTDWPSPFFANGNTVRIENASPTNFNGDFTIANVDSTNGTFEYTLSTFFGGRTAIVTAANHKLNAGDKVKATSGVPTGYNTDVNNSDCGSANPYPITLISTSQFSYRMCNSASSGATTLPVLVGYKSGTSLSGSGTSATLALPGHGFSGATVAISIDTNGGNTSFDTSIDVTANIVNTDTLTYTTPTTITGSANTAKVTATAHGLKVGDLLTVSGVTGDTAYNCAGTCAVVSVIDANTFTYNPTSALSGAAGGTISISATRAFVNTIALTNGSGGSRNLVTATAPGGTTLDVSSSWKATVSGAVDAGFNVSLATVASTSTTVATFSVASSSQPAASSTASTKGTLTFTRDAIASGVSIVPVVAYTGTIHVKKTLTGVTAVSARNNATGTITAGRTADGDATLRAQIINWVRGSDNAEGENTPPGTSPATAGATDVRPSVHGDVLHSRPAVVNYNRQANSDNDIYVFYGGNDGMLRALKGGAAATTVESTINPGDERWAFIPREFFPKFKRLRSNSPAISSTVPRDYTADGPIGVLVQDAVKADGTAGSDGILSAGVTGSGGEVDKVHIFYAFRRGGRFLYALDVTDPAVPKFLWRKSSTDTGFSELGYTWSEPKVAKLRINVSGTVVTKSVLVFGGGYDPSIDDVNSCLLEQSTLTGITIKPIGSGTITYTSAGSCTINNATGSSTTRTRSMGRAIYVLDAADGSIIWEAGPTAGASPNKTITGMCAIPSDVTTVDIDRDGYIERGYVGDTCGNLWRIDIGNSLPANWTIAKIGSVSSTTATDIANKRKFLFPPDVVFSNDGSAYAAILLGSGDREHPFDTNTTDRFYMFKDRTVSGVYNTTTACSGAAVTDPILEANLFDATSVAGNNECGFKLTFTTGEKNVGASVTIAGSTFFNTNQPSSTAGGGACSSNLGIARQYVIDFEDASATHDLSASGGLTLSDRSQTYGQGGFLPSPVPAIVDIDGKRYQVVISGTSIATPEAAALDTRVRTYWYKEFD